MLECLPQQSKACMSICMSLSSMQRGMHALERCDTYKQLSRLLTHHYHLDRLACNVR